MTDNLDFKKTEDWFMHVLEEYFECCDMDALDKKHAQESITALRLADRLQSGEISPEMSNTGKYVLKGSADDFERSQAESVFKAMTTQLMKEVQDDQD